VQRVIPPFAAILLLAACGVGPSPVPSSSTPELVAGTVPKHGITLAVVARPAVAAAGEPFEVEATLTHDRPGPLVVSGSGMGIVFFSVTRLEDGLGSGPPLMDLGCGRHELPAGEPLVVPFFKSGGHSPGDPNAEFMEFYNSSPELSLPAGTWRIDVMTIGNLGEGCDGELLGHEVSVVVTVTD
jgi:hypothetical protein